MKNTQKFLARERRPLTKSLGDKLDVSLVLVAKEQRGWTHEGFAKKIEMTPRALSVSLSRGIPDLGARLKIEAAFDYSLSLGTDPQRLMQRRQCVAALGFDFDLVSKSELQAQCESLEVRDLQGVKTREGLLEKLFQTFAARPSMLQPVGKA